MFEANGSNLQFKFVDGTTSEQDFPRCSLHRCFVEGQFVWVWPGEVQRGQRVVDLQYFAGCPNH